MNQMSSTSTKATPFLANYGFNPRLGFESVPTPQEPQAQGAEQFTARMEEIFDSLRSEILLAQDAQETAANQHRQNALSYRIGDIVWLNSRNIKTHRPAKKRDWKNLGPFKITKKISSHAYELELPASMKNHPIFHVNLLRPAATNPLRGQIIPSPPPVQVDSFNKWEVDKWTGFNDPTWEPPHYLNHTSDLLEQYHHRYPDKPSTQDL